MIDPGFSASNWGMDGKSGSVLKIIFRHEPKGATPGEQLSSNVNTGGESFGSSTESHCLDVMVALQPRIEPLGQTRHEVSACLLDRDWMNQQHTESN